MVLVCIMTLTLVPVLSPTEVSAEATGTTALFNGNATYLLQERFATPASFTGDGTRVFSGWDVDYRGGDVTLDGGAMITDSNAFEKVSMNHKLMQHTGALTFESVFAFATPSDEGFYYEVSGGDNVALRVETVRKAVGEKNVYFSVNGTTTSIIPVTDEEYHLKAEFTGSKVTAWINGEKVLDNAAYKASTTYLDNVEIGTGETGIGKIRIKNVYAYVNYTVNENFLGKTAIGWNEARGEIVTVPGSPYSADTYGFALNSVEAVEPSYKVDEPRVVVKAKTAADYNWTGNAGKVTVTDGASIGGRQNVVAAAGVGNDNSQTVGVVIDGTNFAFAEDDLITYSYDIYLTSSTYARTWIRDMGDFSPWVRVESGDHYVNANKWTTITRTLTYAELCSTVSGDRESSGADGWTTPGKFVVCIRPGVAQTAYLDNFIVKVTKADDNYLSNAATGARVQWTKPLNSWDNNVMYSTNVSGMEYIADPAGVKSSNVLKAVVGTAGIDGVIAIKATDDFGAPIVDTKVGDIIDVSFDLRSSVAQNSTAINGVALRIGGSNFANGSAGPTGAAYDMGNVNVAANTWTTIKHSYTVTSDKVLAPSSTQNLYILIRVPTAGTIYIDNLKFVIRNPEDAVLAPTWEAQKASDFTWKGQTPSTTVTDAQDPEGKRGTVAYASNLSDGNNNTIGFLLGNSFQFKPGDIISYSYDVYSPKAYGPAMEIRDQDGNWSARKQFPNVSITANKWTTVSGSITYSDLVAGGAGFANADKYAIFIRPNTSVGLYLDNFIVRVYNRDKHVLSIEDGANLVVGGTIDEVADLTDRGATATAGHTIGGKSNVVQVTGSNAHGGRAGILIGNNFAFKQGDVLEYSINIYPTKSYTLKDGPSANLDYILLRNSTTTPYRNVAPNMTLEANKWQTITNRISFDDLQANQMGSATNGWATEGSYGIYLRLAGTYYISDFTAKVIRPEYAFGEPPSNASLRKTFAALSGAQTLTFDVLVPKTGADGFKATLGGATVKIDGGKFYLGDTELYTVTNNVWYRVKLVVDGSTAGLYINGDFKGTGSVSGDITSVAFENTSGKQIMVDNIQVAPTFDPDDFGSEYPELNDADIPTAITQSNQQLSLGMVSYPMWREGMHYGWDLITPYENRVPYLGYYTGGSPEVADWNIKWWAEHGFDHVIYPFVRPAINEAGGAPQYSVRGEELIDGYMNAKYKDKVDFAIMLSNPLEGQFTNAAEWIENVLPFITEHYFKDPNYKKIDNQLVVYNYNIDGFTDLLQIEDESGNVTQNGITELVSILTALNNKAIELGYTGIMFVVDQTSVGEEDLETITNSISSAVSTVYYWRYSWNSDVVTNITNGITNDYNAWMGTKVVASIPMGYENIPWTYNEVGMLEPSEIETICNTVVSKRGSDDPKLVLFTCWDEWGEGHFFSPSSKSGFDYLNAVRKTLTTSKAAITTETPTENAKKRMGVLYPEGRQILKIREDKKETIDPAIFTNEIGTLTPSRSNFEDRSGCKYQGNFLSGYDYTTYDVQSSSQASVWFTAPNIDYTKVTAIKFVGYAENSSSLVVKYGTDDDDPFEDESGDNSFRFSCANTDPVNKLTKEYILIPNNPSKLSGAKNVDFIRFNTQQNTSDGGEFHIEKIVFYGDPVPNLGTNVNVDGVPYTMVSKAIEGTNGTTMIPAYRFLIEAGAKVTWDKSNQDLYATMNGVTAKYHAGNRNVVDESNTVLATAAEGAAHKYQDGNLFVDYSALLKPFGYTVEVGFAGEINYFSPDYKIEIDNTDFRWDFNKDGDTEGWSLAAGSKEPVTYVQSGYAITVKDGVLHYRAAVGDSNMAIAGLSMPKTSAQHFTIKLDTDATQMLLRLYDAGTYNTAGGLVYVVNIPAADGPQEIVLDLSTTTPRDAGASFEKLADTVTKVRLDAVYGKTGSNKIDYIQFGEPTLFKFKAFSFGDNIFTDYKAAYWNHTGTVKSSDWGAIDLTDEGDIIIKPAEGQQHGMSGITWIKNGTDLASVVSGKIVRVSFDYKGVGDITSFRFENRNASARDGEEFTANVTSEWQHFDAYINVDEVSSARRWFGIRAIRSDSTGDDYLVVRDWQIRILDESTEVSMFTDAGVAIKAIDVLNENKANDKVFVGAYDTAKKELNNFTSGKVPNDVTIHTNETTKTETLPYYYIAPTDATTEIRAYWWDNLNPLSEPFILTKKAN